MYKNQGKARWLLYQKHALACGNDTNFLSLHSKIAYLRLEYILQVISKLILNCQLSKKYFSDVGHLSQRRDYNLI